MSFICPFFSPTWYTSPSLNSFSSFSLFVYISSTFANDGISLCTTEFNAPSTISLSTFFEYLVDGASDWYFIRLLSCCLNSLICFIVMFWRFGSIALITFHATFTGFISAGLAVVLKLNSPSGVNEIQFFANTSYTLYRNDDMLYGLVVLSSTWYSLPSSWSLDSYSSNLLSSSCPTSSIGPSIIFWLSNGAPSSLIIASILSR